MPKAPRRNVRYIQGVCTGDAEFSKTDNGTAQVFVKAEVPGEGLKTVILFMSDAAMPYTQEKLRAVGWSGKGPIGPQIKGNTCELCLYEEEYQGEWKAKADFAQSGNGGLKAKNPATASEEADMLAKLEIAAATNESFVPPSATAAPAKKLMF
jgi:hypothetical protein